MSTALYRASIELHEAALGAHTVGGEHWMSVDVATEGVLDRWRGGRVECQEEVAVFLRWKVLDIVHPVCSVRFGSGWIELVLVSIYDRVEEKTDHVHVLFRNR